MDIVDDPAEPDFRGEGDEDLHKEENARLLAGDEVWEEFGCVLWDLAANQTHAELMVLELAPCLYGILSENNSTICLSVKDYWRLGI